MARILSVGTAVPECTVHQECARDFASRLFSGAGNHVERLLTVFENTTIRQRHLCMPVEWFEEQQDFAEKNRIYIESGVELAEAAIRDACDRAGISPSDIGHIFFVSSTGIATPSLDAHLFNRLKFRPAIFRTPIWGLGCAGGIAGMIRASHWLKAFPEETALVVALELCGLTFIRNDLSKSNFVATSLFADGCGAAVLAGDQSTMGNGSGLLIEGTAAVTWENTLEIMGWEIVDGGLKVLFSKSIPRVVHSSARPVVVGFLEERGVAMSDVRHFLSHPGGAKVIEAYKDALGLEESQVRSMREVLSGYGNMSSATILFVFRHFLDSGEYRRGDRAFGTALGPGFSSEMMLMRCL